MGCLQACLRRSKHGPGLERTPWVPVSIPHPDEQSSRERLRMGEISKRIRSSAHVGIRRRVYLVHFSVAALAVSVAVAVLVWRRSVAIELQGAALVAAAMLVTPHLLHYDTVLLALPIAWLATDGLRSRFLPGDIVILVMRWLCPSLTLSLARRGLPLTPICHSGSAVHMRAAQCLPDCNTF
jgi:hypothetical protein